MSVIMHIDVEHWVCNCVPGSIVQPGILSLMETADAASLTAQRTAQTQATDDIIRC